MQPDLIKSYLTASWNHGAKHLSSTLLKTFGLAFGYLAAVLILLFVRDELAYDKWLPDSDRLYKLEVVYTPPGRDEIPFARTPYPALDALANHFPGAFESTTRVLAREVVVRKNSAGIKENFHYVDGDFLGIFALRLEEGEGGDLGSRPDGILLSRSAALKYFGEGNAVGKTLTVNEETVHVVLGVYADTPENSHFRPDFVAQLPSHGFANPEKFNSWRQIYVHSYFKVSNVSDIQKIRDNLKAFVDAKVPADNDWVPSQRMRLEVLPLTSIHLHSKSRLQLSAEVGDSAVVNTFLLVGVMILSVSLVNFSSLSLSQSMLRAREISVRKIVGATRRDITIQFLLESVLISLTAMVIAVVVANLVLPYFNEYVQKDLQLGLAANVGLFAGLATTAIAVGLVAGAYPAFVMSSFAPGKALRAANRSGGLGRNVAVFLQFSLAAVLMIATAVIYLQTNYASQIDAGFDKEYKLQLAIPPSASVQSETLAQRALSIRGVKLVGMSDDALPAENNKNITLQIPGAKDTELLVVEKVSVDHDFFAVYGVRPLSGRLFSESMAADQLVLDEKDGPINSGVVVNSKFVLKAGYSTPDQAIGKSVTATINDKLVTATIVGVVNDMHTRSVHFPVAPTMFFLEDRSALGYMSLQVEPEALSSVATALDSLWFELEPAIPIERSLVSRAFADLYRAEIKKANLFALFALLAVFMACLGLYSLAAFTLERRMAEIALRKVLGATRDSLVILMLKQFLLPALIAVAVALPLVLLFLSNWLKTFEYRVSLLANVHIIIACVLLIVLIASLTALNKVLEAVSRRPAEILNNE